MVPDLVSRADDKLCGITTLPDARDVTVRRGLRSQQRSISAFLFRACSVTHLPRASARSTAVGMPNSTAPANSMVRALCRVVTNSGSFHRRRVNDSGGDKPLGKVCSTGRGSHLSIRALRIACWISRASSQARRNHRCTVLLHPWSSSAWLTSPALCRPAPPLSHGHSLSKTNSQQK